MLGRSLTRAAIIAAGVFLSSGRIVASPIVINSLQDLENISSDLSADYLLASDIDASATAGLNSGAGFIPIGSASNPFYGSFDGGGHTIKGLTINSAIDNNVGLFGYVSGGGGLKNLVLTGETVTANRTGPTGTMLSIGGLAGYSTAPISNVSVSAAIHTSLVDGGANVGGLVGFTYGSIANSSSAGTVTTSTASGGNYVGGLAGTANGSITGSHSTANVVTSGITIAGGLIGRDAPLCAYCTGEGISKSYATGSVSTGVNGAAGGLAGVYTGAIDQSFATGSVVGGDEAGGLVGDLQATQIIRDSISNSYATGSVTTANPYVQYIGGLVGGLHFGSVSSSYSTGAVITGPALPTASVAAGGFIGLDGGTNASYGYFSNSYWDLQTSGRNQALGGGTGGPAGIGYLTTGNFKSGRLPSGFDSTVWNATPGQYPTLSAIGGAPSPQDSAPSVLTLSKISGATYAQTVFYPTDQYIEIQRRTLSSGVIAVAYKSGNQIVVAFRGTDIASATGMKDVFSDASFVTGDPTSSMRLYVEEAANFVAGLHTTYGNNITLTGHSLGGAIASILGAASGFRAVAFDAPGAGLLMPQLSNEVSPVNGLAGSSGPMPVNYRLWGDQVSLWGPPIGRILTVGPLGGQSETSVSWSDALKDHDINLMVKALTPDMQIDPGALGPFAAVKDIVTATLLGGAYYLSKDVEPLIDYALDPDATAGGYRYLSVDGSPLLASIELPSLPDITGYELSLFDGQMWLPAAYILPDSWIDLPFGTVGFEFKGFNGSSPVNFSGPFLFDGKFASSGRLAATVTPLAAIPTPEPPALVLFASSIGLLMFAFSMQTRIRRRRTLLPARDL